MKRTLILMLVLLVTLSVAAQQKDLKNFITEAQKLQGEGKYEEAVELMREAVVIYPDECDAHLHLGLTLGEWGQRGQDMTQLFNVFNEVFVELEKAEALDNSNIDAHFYLGVYGVNVPIFFGKLDPGVEHLEKSLAFIRDDKESEEYIPSIYRFLGQGYELQGLDEKAYEAWKKALELSPEGEIGDAARNHLADLEKTKASKVMEVEKQKESIRIGSLKRKIEIAPGDFNLMLELGKAYYDEKNWISATKALKRAVNMDTTHAEAQFLLARAVMEDASTGYDERIYKDQNARTGLALDMVNQIERALKLDPNNLEARMIHAVGCVQMPFFIQRMDQGLASLEAIANDENISDDVRAEAMYHLGYGYRKKGTALWMKLIKKYPKSDQINGGYGEFGLRESGKEIGLKETGNVLVTFHLGFMDELAPQTGVWVEDSKGDFVKTLYVSGFSGFARERQIQLPAWGKKSKFETDGTTGASIDWGKHTYAWDLTNHKGQRVENGIYRVHVEISWWPSMKYGLTSAEIQIGEEPAEVVVEKPPFIPLLQVQYLK